MPASSASVSQAAPWASAENTTSAQGEARRGAGGRSFMSERLCSSARMKGVAGSVAATGVLG